MSSKARGFTIAEMMVTVLVASLLIAIALPSMRETIAKRRLDGATNELSADLQQARTLAVSDNAIVTLAMTSSTAYSVTSNQTTKSVTLPSGVSITGVDASGNAISGNTSVVFQPMRGCIGASDINCTGSTVQFQLSSTGTTGTLRLVVNNMGRVQLCSPSGSFKGYSSC